jgi:hypothetical protein
VAQSAINNRKQGRFCPVQFLEERGAGSQRNYQVVQQKGPSPGQVFNIGRQQATVIGRDASSDIVVPATGAIS